MTFTSQQVDLLKAPLSTSAVKSRSQAGRSLSYIEGWHAIAEANRIFGFDGWDRTLSALKQLGEPREIDGKWRVAYMATVRITVRPPHQADPDWWIERDGCGYGSGIDRDLGQAHESALKEAETDAMKRALMTFGNPFGLALYDKEQRNVSDAPPPNEPDPAQAEYVRSCWDRIRHPSATEAELREWWRSQSAARRSFDLSQTLVDEMKAALGARLETFKVAA